jgi:hypothetical protein
MAMTSIPYLLAFGIEGSIDGSGGESQIEQNQEAGIGTNIPFTFWHLKRKLLPNSKLGQTRCEGISPLWR